MVGIRGISGTWLVLVALLALSCGRMSDLRQDLQVAEGLWNVSGVVSAENYGGEPVVVGILRGPSRTGEPWQIVDFQQMTHPTRFSFIVPPGRYRLVAFIDANSDLQYQATERLGTYRGYEEINESNRTGDLDIAIVGAVGDGDAVPAFAGPTAEIRSLDIGSVLSLDDERFGAELGELGVWQPMRFMEEHGAGLWMLAPYDPSKTPVVFIHGISGYPQEFRHIIASLDTTRFQPWVVMYPSGWDLGASAEYFHRGLEEMHSSLGFERMCLVAHSMGGVVSRQMFNRHYDEHEESYIHGFVTIASPLGGHPAAALGARMSPVVVPSWRNLVPDGEFIGQLYARPLREQTRYALFFTLEDGVVPLPSQLRREALDEAARTRHFPNTHVGVLESETLFEQLAVELDHCRGDRDQPEAPAPVAAAPAAAE